MSVARICSRSTDIAEPSESVQVAARRMLDRDVGTLVVVNPLQEPIGMITDRDLVIRVLADSKDAATVSVADVMTQEPLVVTETTPIEDALRIMRSGPYRRLPVVDGNGKLVGIVSLDDILELLGEEFSSISVLLRHESPSVSLVAGRSEV